MEAIIEGRVWTLGRDVDTDGIISGKYLTIIDPQELKKHVFEIALPEFAQGARPGDILVAERTSGPARAGNMPRRRSRRSGSARSWRTPSPGSSSVTRSTWGFLRSRSEGSARCSRRAIRPASTCAAGRIRNARTGTTLKFPPLPNHLLELLEAGGLVEKVRLELLAQGENAPA